jgi:hypothetical protein
MYVAVGFLIQATFVLVIDHQQNTPLLHACALIALCMFNK